jgi:hypothetical protein
VPSFTLDLSSPSRCLQPRWRRSRQFRVPPLRFRHQLPARLSDGKPLDTSRNHFRYPDATFSPRLSYGSVAGYSAGGRQIGPFTYVKGLYERATGSRPFALPPRWIAAQAALNPQQPFDLVTTNDAVGGNSGSPLINKDGQIVGLMFDGNIESLGGDYGYDGTVNRAVFVSVGILREGLAKVYHADRLVAELAQ